MKSSYLRAGLALLCAVILSACGGNNGSLALSGSVNGLTKTGLVLINKGNGEKLPIEPNTSTFVFTKLLATDEQFDVEIDTPPAGAKCTLANNVNKANGYNVYVTVTCVTNPYTLGGSVKGLKGKGLVVANGSDLVSIEPPATAGADVSFVFPTKVADGSLFGASVLTQPTGQTCAVDPINNPGTMPSGDALGLIVKCN